MVYAHVDLDCFFVQVARRLDPRLRKAPVAVLAKSAVVSASYEARSCGVHAGMTTAVARTMCPTVVFADVNRDEVAIASDLVFSSLRTTAQRRGWSVHQTGVDEAFVSAASWAELIPPLARWREACRTETGYICSVGAGPSRLVAKIASGLAKPDGFLPVPSETATDWIAPLPVALIPGVGPRAAELLHELNVKTIGDVKRCGHEELHAVLGSALTNLVVCASDAVDPAPPQVHRRATPQRSIGLSQTLPPTSPSATIGVITEMCGRLAARLFQRSTGCATLTVTVRLEQGQQLSRSVRAHGAYTASQLTEIAITALANLVPDQSTTLRLVGVSCEQTVVQQPGLFPRQSIDGLVSGATVAHSAFGVGVIDVPLDEPGLIRVRFSDRTRDVLAETLNTLEPN